MQDCIVFDLGVVIGLENLCHPLNQSATKLNQAQPAHRRFPALFHNEFSLDPCELFLRS